MNQFEIAKKLLLTIVEKDMTFSIAKRNILYKLDVDNVIKGHVSDLVGCELRHHLVNDSLISRFFDEMEFEKTIYLRFAIANHLYLRRFNEKELLELAYKDLDKEKITTLFEFIDSTNEIIPPDLDKTSPEFLSIRYNTPAWVIRMWQKQFGKGVVFKTLKVNYRQRTLTFRVNPHSVDIDEFVGKHPDFSKCPIEGMMVYQGRGNPKNLPEYKSNDIFLMKMATKYVLDQLDLDPLKGIAVYTEVANNIYLDLISRFGKGVNLDLVVNHPSYFFETRRHIQENGYSHIYIYESEVSGLITCLSKKVHTFICMPKSTSLDLLRTTPDYFLKIKQNQLDDILASEMSSLEESANFVETGGELIYMISTMSRKESNSLIANFLIKHPEFSLVEEKQFFPFEIYDSCLYYARLKKAEEPSD